MEYTEENTIAVKKEDNVATRAICRGMEKILSEYDTRINDAFTLFMFNMINIGLT